MKAVSILVVTVELIAVIKLWANNYTVQIDNLPECCYSLLQSIINPYRIEFTL